MHWGPYTTLHLGGPARYFATCSTLETLRSALAWADSMHLDVHAGGGSNVVFADEGFGGLVLKIDLQGVQFDAQTARVAAGENWDHFVAQCVRRGLAGVECLSGIPGQVGATPIQNVGAYGQEVRETITSVRAIDRNSLQEVEFTRAECDFSYRHSRFKGPDADRFIITEVRYALREDGHPHLRYAELEQAVEMHQTAGLDALNAVRTAVLPLRAGKSMVVAPDDPNSRSAGSFFVNPVLSPEQFSTLQQQAEDVPLFSRRRRCKGARSMARRTGWLCQGIQARRGGPYSGMPWHSSTTTAAPASLLELAADIQREVEAQFSIMPEARTRRRVVEVSHGNIFTWRIEPATNSALHQQRA